MSVSEPEPNIYNEPYQILTDQKNGYLKSLEIGFDVWIPRIATTNIFCQILL